MSGHADSWTDCLVFLEEKKLHYDGNRLGLCALWGVLVEVEVKEKEGKEWEQRRGIEMKAAAGMACWNTYPQETSGL